MNREPKITLVERILMMELALIGDIAEALLTLGAGLPVIGPALPVAAFFIGFAISGILIFWLIIKGVSIKWFLGGSGIDLIPGVNALPARTAALVMTFIKDSRGSKKQANKKAKI